MIDLFTDMIDVLTDLTNVLTELMNLLTDLSSYEPEQMLLKLSSHMLAHAARNKHQE